MQTLTRQLEQAEARRPAKIDGTFDRIAARHDRDVARTATVSDRVTDAIDEDLQRWQDRQPRYREAFDKARRGDPDTATESMMHLLF
ncbi:MAG: hypothetical protein JXA69_10295 [Phycisphaerae bacterium]|nr:hypothetical protein [Phycisphaerae bacterium]